MNGGEAGVPAPAPEVGRELASTMTALIDGAPSAFTTIAAVERIRAWHEAMRRLSVIAEAQVMEACWIIRVEIPDRDRYLDHIGTHLRGVLDPERAWVMSETWAVARRQRSLRELAHEQPESAIRFVGDFVRGGVAADEVLEGLDEDDRRVAEILSSSPRRRTEQIRALIRSCRERDVHGAASAADATPAERSPPPPPSDAGDRMAAWAQWMRTLRAGAEALERLAREIPDLEGLSRRRCEHILSLTDLAAGAIDAIAGWAHEAEKRVGRRPGWAASGIPADPE